MQAVPGSVATLLNTIAVISTVLWWFNSSKKPNPKFNIAALSEPPNTLGTQLFGYRLKHVEHLLINGNIKLFFLSNTMRRWWGNKKSCTLRPTETKFQILRFKDANKNASYQKKNLDKKFASSTGDFCILSAPPVWFLCTWGVVSVRVAHICVSPGWLCSHRHEHTHTHTHTPTHTNRRVLAWLILHFLQ